MCEADKLAGMSLEEIQAHARYSAESTNAVVETLFKALVKERADKEREDLGGRADALSWDEAMKLATRAVHDDDGRGMVGRGRNHLVERVARALSALSKARSAGNQDVREKVIEECKRVAYRTCAETRHITLGDNVAAALDALKHSPKAGQGEAQ
jgi:hypothetical protein